MSNLVRSIIVAAALCFATSSSANALSAEFKHNYFIGMINPKSWDGPWWWGLRSAVKAVAVSHVSGKEIRSDRRGTRAYRVSFTLVNVGDSRAGEKALVLRAADEAAPDRWLSVLRNADPSPQPWAVGTAATTPALEPGDSAELSIVVYLDASRALDESAQDTLVQLDLSAE